MFKKTLCYCFIIIGFFILLGTNFVCIATTLVTPPDEGICQACGSDGGGAASKFSRGTCSTTCNFGTCDKDSNGKYVCRKTSICIGDYGANASYCKYSSYFFTSRGDRLCRFDLNACSSYTKDSQKKYGACNTAADCAKCSTQKPDYPYYKCDRAKSTCNITYECGKNECKRGTDCCPIGQTNPHWTCTNNYDCISSSTCGKNECDPKETKWVTSVAWDRWENSKCKVFSCNTKTAQCFWDIVNGVDYKKCVSSCTTTTTKKSVTTTSTSTIPTPGGSTTSSTIRSTTSTTTTTSPSIACYISTLRFYDKKNDHEYKDAYSMFSKPDLGILDNPRLEYTAIDCDTCKLTITPAIPNFLSTNPNIFGNLSGEKITGHPGRFIFDKSVFNSESIILNVNELTPGSYTITLECTDPATGDTQTKSIKLNVFPQLRWREVVPVID